MRKIRYNARAGQEPFLDYVAPFMADYMAAMKNFILPSKEDTLLRHFDAFATFIDSLSDYIFDRHERRKRLSGESKAVMPSPYGAPKGPGIFAAKRVKAWYDSASSSSSSSSEEEMTVDIDEGHLPRRGIGLSMLGEMQNDDTLFIDEELVINMGELSSIAMDWHNDVIGRGKVLTGRYANCYFLSWTCFCRLFYLIIYDMPVKYKAYKNCVAAKHPYCLANANSNLIVTPVPLKEYSIRNLWNTMRPLVDTLYTVQYNHTMKEYLHIIFFRYCSFLTVVCGATPNNAIEEELGAYGGDDDDDGGEYDDEEEEDEIYDDPSFVILTRKTTNGNDEEEEEVELDDELDITEEPFDAYKQLTVPVHPKYSITSKFVYEGELLFYSQIMRVNLSVKLMNYYKASQHYANQMYPLAYMERIEMCKEAWFAMTNELVVHKEISGSINEIFKSAMIHIYMYHGEKERFTREYPESSNDSSDVISKIRRNDFLKISEIRQITLATLANIYHTGLEEVLQRFGEASTQQLRLNGIQGGGGGGDTTPVNLQPFETIIYEREMTLVTFTCTTEWLRYKSGQNWETIQDYFIVEDITLIWRVIIAFARRHMVAASNAGIKRNITTSAPTTNGTRMPYLLKLMQVYYVVDMEPQGKGIYATHFLVEAYLMWLKLLHTQKYLPSKLIHPTLHTCLSHM